VTDALLMELALPLTKRTRYSNRTKEWRDLNHLPQPQSLPQLHFLLSFIGQFLPVFLQLSFSTAKVLVQIIAARIDIRIVVIVFIRTILTTISGECN